MIPRLVAGGLLLASAALAWLAVSHPAVARALQLAIAASIAYVAWLALRAWRVMTSPPPPPVGAAPPSGFVTLLLPARNEAPVIAGTILSIGAITGAGARYELLVVDDGSDDGTWEIATAAAAGLEHARAVRRPPGSGPRTKGAALAWAMPRARGEVIGVLDADTRVEPDFLDRVARAWSRDPAAAAIQVSRRVRNVSRSALAAAQDDEQLMDLASQCGRWATEGTAELRGNGMFVRRDVLEAVGGWSTSAITEDLELSTRLAARGHHVAVAPDAALREEAVETVAALWQQRNRWAEGSIRRLLEHGPGMVVGPLPLGRKLDFLAFSTEFVVPPLFVAAVLAGLLTIILPQPADWTVAASLALGYGAGVFALALAGLHATGSRGAVLVGRAARGALFLSHWLVIVPFVLMRIALGAPTTDFTTTPRFEADGG